MTRMFCKETSQKVMGTRANNTHMFIDPSVQVIPSFVATWASEDHTSPQCRAEMVLDSIPSQQFWCNKPLDQSTEINDIRKGATETSVDAYW